MSFADAVMGDGRILSLMDELTRQLNPDEVVLLKALLAQNPGKELDVLHELIGYTYRWQPVGMREFVESPKYLNMKGQVFPVLLDDLEELFDSKTYDEAILTGGIGWGKSTFAELALIRMIYETSCLRNPQKTFDLADGTNIAFVNVSINKEHSKKVVFHGIKTKLLNSHYFRNTFPYDAELSEEMRFPNNISIFPTVDPIGLNVLGGVLDEVNFMGVTEKSARAAGGRYDAAQDLHDNMIRRMKSRFMRNGRMPGILLSISSSRYPDDFTERQIKQALETDAEGIFIRRYSQWGTKPASFFLGETFKLSLGDTVEKPRVIDDPMEAKELDEMGMPLIDVPIEYRKDFMLDMDGSIRDLAGYPTLTLSPFITQRHKIHDAVNRGRELGLEHPFSKEVTTLKDGATFLLDKFRIDAFDFNDQGVRISDRVRSSKPRYLHIDLALRRDGVGLCMGHVSGWKEETRRDESGNLYRELAPIIVIDLLLRVEAHKEEEVEIADVRSLVFELRSLGFNIAKVTFDQFQSAESIQQLKRRGIDAERLSIDANPETYHSVREAMYEDRLYLYDYPTLTTELTRLEENHSNGKIDHPKRGSKDVSDALAGVVYHCTVEKPTMNLAPSMGYTNENAPKSKMIGGIVVQHDPLDNFDDW